jgi:L-gulono-1,4-lactone dehydrogenase
MATWRNWAGNQSSQPVRVRSPRGTEEVVAAVHAAAAAGLTVKATGAGHSFTPIAATDGVQVLPHRMSRIRSVDMDAGQVTVEAGMPLHAFNDAIAALGLSLANMGDIAVQTVAGATATGTHGTGRDSAGLAAQIAGLELVTADGSVLTCSATENPDVFAAARVGLGALGIVTAITFSVQPAFLLHAVERPMRWEEVLADLDGLADRNEHFEFYWFPHTEYCLTKQNNRTDGPARPLSRLRGWWDDEFVANNVFGAYARLGRRIPGMVRRGNLLSGVLLSAREYVDAAHKVFTSTRRVRFVESEYALPRESLPQVLRELRRTIEASPWRISFPIEVRFAPADQVWMSTGHGRQTAYVAIHQYIGSPGLDWYFPAAERIFCAAGGRPHWGKLHTRGPEYLAAACPRYVDFVALRDKLDPQRRFTNPYLTSILGD